MKRTRDRTIFSVEINTGIILEDKRRVKIRRYCVRTTWKHTYEILVQTLNIACGIFGRESCKSRGETVGRSTASFDSTVLPIIRAVICIESATKIEYIRDICIEISILLLLP